MKPFWEHVRAHLEAVQAANEATSQDIIDHEIQQAILTIPALQDAADLTIDLILFCGRHFGDPVTGLLMRHWRPLNNMQVDDHARAYALRASKICQIEREMERRHRAGQVCACRWSQWHGAHAYDYKKHVVVAIKAKRIAAAKGVSAKCAARACICDCQPGVCSWLDMQTAAAVATTDAPASQGRHDQLLVSITRSIYHTHAHAHIHAHAYVHARAHARAYALVSQTTVGQSEFASRKLLAVPCYKKYISDSRAQAPVTFVYISRTRMRTSTPMRTYTHAHTHV